MSTSCYQRLILLLLRDKVQGAKLSCANIFQASALVQSANIHDPKQSLLVKCNIHGQRTASL